MIPGAQSVPGIICFSLGSVRGDDRPATQGRTLVDLHEQRKLEVARQMAEAKAQAKPWHAIFATPGDAPGGDAPQA